MGLNLEIPKAEKISSAQEGVRILQDLDKKINKTSDLIDKEKKEIRELMKSLTSKFSKSKGAARDYLIAVIRDLEGDLNDLNGEFKIDTHDKEKLIELAKAPEYSIKYNPKLRNSPEIAQSLNLIYLQVVHNGTVKPIILSADELKSNPSIKIDGYIASVMVFGTKKMDVSLGEMKAKPIMYNNKDSFMTSTGSGYESIYYQALSTKKYSGSKLGNLCRGKGKISSFKEMPGRYMLGADASNNIFMGNALLSSRKASLKFKIGSKNYELPIEQRSNEFYKNICGYKFNYLGNNKEKFSKIKNFGAKLKAIAEGVKEIEVQFGGKLIEKINLIDFSGFRSLNASASRNEKKITFMTGLLRNSTLADIRVTTRHEVLHKYVFERGYTKNKGVRSVFADLKGVKGERRQIIIDNGWAPFGSSRGYDNEEFFNFINERNFFKVDSGGHSHGNVYEFITSFYNTLMSIDRLEDNLSKPIVIVKGMVKKTVKLSKAQKLKILDKYILTLKAIIEACPVNPVPILSPLIKPQVWKEKVFLRKKLAYVEKIKAKIV